MTTTTTTTIQGVVRSGCTSLLSSANSILFVVAIGHWKRTSRLKNGRGILGDNYS